MRTDRQGVGGAHRARRMAGAATPASFAWFLKAQVALAFVAGSFILASPAQAQPADQARQVVPAQHRPLAGLAEDHRILGRATPREGLPFARPDLAMLVLGGALVTLVAAGAPLLLQLRSSPPVFATTVSASDPLRPTGAHGSAAHARA